MTLPSASTRLSDQAGSAPVGTDLCAVFAACTTLADGVPRLYSNLDALITAHGYSEGAEYAGLHMEGTRKPVLFVPLPIGTAGSMGRQNSSHTGTSKVSAAAGTSGVLAEVDGVITVVRGGTVGTDQIILGVSLDGGTTTKNARVGTATSYVIPSIGVTVSLGTGGTLVAGDTVLEFSTVAPIFDAAGVTLGKTKTIAQSRQVRSWIFVGDVPTLALGQAIESAVNAYETSAERYCVAKFQVRDKRTVTSSGLQVAMVGASNSITFAEVGGTGDTITRVAGSFITDGFTVGDYVRVTGAVVNSGANNVRGKITNVAALVLTLDTADLEAEAGVTTVAITGEPSFVFAAGTTITRNRGSWVAEGFAVGDTIAITGTTSNNVSAVITTISATVITCSATTFVAETIGSASATITVAETETAWMADVESDFAAIASSERANPGAGRLTKLSPITGYTMRRPVQWADSIRSYQVDLSVPTWRKSDGSLDGWGIEGEHDERVNEGLIDGRFTCARTWSNGPAGAFIAESLTRATDGSVLGMTHNMYVSSLVQTVVQRETENFVGSTMVLNEPDAGGVRTATTSSLRVLEAKVDAALLNNRKPSFPGENPRWSSARWRAATDDNLAIAGATMHGVCTLDLNGTIVNVATTVEVR